MLPLILVAVGAYLIGDSVLADKKYAHGGKTQGYDDKEDERLAMEHGKMSKKDLDSTHARRDDARFEERGKMAKGGSIAENTTVEVGEDKISVIKNRKEKTGFAVYVQAKGYAPSTLDVYKTKEDAIKKGKSLAKKFGYKFVS
jgi:hypothetical protein